MIGIPISPNSIHVPMVRTECCKSEFDTAYPVHLNGIISQGEYIQSIDKINQNFGSNRKIILMPIISFFILFILIAIFIPLIVVSNPENAFPIIPIIMGVAFGGFFLMIILMIVLSFRRVARLRQAVAEESAKYSSRPTPCSWRLETTQYFTGDYENNTTAITYHIIIDIGRSVSNAYYNNESSYLIGQQNVFASPSYYAASNPTCSQCGTIRSDPSARFCSSCGQTLK